METSEIILVHFLQSKLYSRSPCMMKAQVNLLWMIVVIMWVSTVC